MGAGLFEEALQVEALRGLAGGEEFETGFLRFFFSTVGMDGFVQGR